MSFQPQVSKSYLLMGTPLNWATSSLLFVIVCNMFFCSFKIYLMDVGCHDLLVTKKSVGLGKKETYKRDNWTHLTNN